MGRPEVVVIPTPGEPAVGTPDGRSPRLAVLVVSGLSGFAAIPRSRGRRGACSGEAGMRSRDGADRQDQAYSEEQDKQLAPPLGAGMTGGHCFSFGNRAVSERPLALRTRLATRVPLSGFAERVRERSGELARLLLQVLHKSFCPCTELFDRAPGILERSGVIWAFGCMPADR